MCGSFLSCDISEGSCLSARDLSSLKYSVARRKTHRAPGVCPARSWEGGRRWSLEAEMIENEGFSIFLEPRRGRALCRPASAHHGSAQGTTPTRRSQRL